MNLLHICIYFRNPMFEGLMKSQEKLNINKRVFYYETRKIGLKSFDYDYVDYCTCDNLLLPTPFLRFVRIKKIFKKMIKIYDGKTNIIDCVHAHTLISDGYLAFLFKKMYNIPYVITIRDSDTLFKPYWNLKLYKRIIRDIINNSSGLVFLSKTSKEKFHNLLSNKNLKFIPKSEYIIPNGIDDFWHKNNHCSKTKKISKNDQINIITVGKICERKNQVVSCEAIKKLIEDGYNINYTIIGKVENNKMYKEICNYSFVKVIDYMNKQDLIKEYRKNDIFLLASRNETFGLVYAEALSQGLPIIYSKGQGFDQQFEDGVCGYPVISSSPEDIKEKVIKIINNYDEIIVNTINCSKKFNWNSVAEELEKVYKDVKKGMES